MSVKITSFLIQTEFTLRLYLSERDYQTRKTIIDCNFGLSSVKLIFMLLQATSNDVKQVFLL